MTQSAAQNGVDGSLYEAGKLGSGKLVDELRISAAHSSVL